MSTSRSRPPAPSGSRDPAATIVADDLRCGEEREGAVLSCRLRGPGLPDRLWFRVPLDTAGALDATADAFLPPLLVAAMCAGARLVLEGEVSVALLRAVPAIMELFTDASGTIGQPLGAVPLEVGARRRETRGAAAGAFFSGGIDSYYTVLRNAARYDATDARRVTQLLVVHGFDVRLDDTALFRQIRERLAGASAELGMRLVPVTTNVRDVVGGIPWDYAHGAAMAGTGLALGGLLHTCYIAGSNSIRTCGFYGTHPGLDPLWSTEAVEFITDGPMLGKLVKAPVVLASPAARRSLRVCWENPGGAYNCGRCEKCLRTLIILTLCGQLGQVQTLPATVDLEALARVPIAPFLVNLWQGLRGRLAAADPASALLPALDEALERSQRRTSWAVQARTTLFHALGRIGLTPPRIVGLDRRFLGGGAARAYARLTRRRPHP